MTKEFFKHYNIYDDSYEVLLYKLDLSAKNSIAKVIDGIVFKLRECEREMEMKCYESFDVRWNEENNDI